MTHLDEEEIAGLIDGTVSKKERKQYRTHLSECDKCATIYSEIVTIIDEEEEAAVSKTPAAPAPSISIGHWLKTAFSLPAYKVGFAVLVILLIMVPFVSRYIQTAGIEEAKKQYIVRSVLEIENQGAQGFSHPTDKNYAAFRAGFFFEELVFMVETGGDKEERRKIGKLLSRELRVIKGSNTGLNIHNPAHLNKKNIQKTIDSIRDLVKKESLSELFQMGRFVERTLLSTFDANPQPLEIKVIERHRAISEKYKEVLGREIIERFNELKTATDAEKRRKTLLEIKKIFY
ncbi:MAG: hypothetical protein GY757_51820 [bacterium]|nr:hypothetical protein [bacterium]